MSSEPLLLSVSALGRDYDRGAVQRLHEVSFERAASARRWRRDRALGLREEHAAVA